MIPNVAQCILNIEDGISKIKMKIVPMNTFAVNDHCPFGAILLNFDVMPKPIMNWTVAL